MTAIEIEVTEAINGVAVSVRVAWSPEAWRSALAIPEGVSEAETREYLSSRLSRAMQRALLQVRESAEESLSRSLVEFLKQEVEELARIERRTNEAQA